MVRKSAIENNEKQKPIRESLQLFKLKVLVGFPVIGLGGERWRLWTVFVRQPFDYRCDTPKQIQHIDGHGVRTVHGRASVGRLSAFGGLRLCRVAERKEMRKRIRLWNSFG